MSRCLSILSQVCFLAALMTVQSVVPCCAINVTSADGDRAYDLSSTVIQPCSCCQHLLPQKEPIPPDDGHSPDHKCLFCSGLVYHSAAETTMASVTKNLEVYSPCEDSRRRNCERNSELFPILHRQTLSQKSLNLGSCLLI